MAILIINSGRCSHGKCAFCGYGRIRGFESTKENVIECLNKFFETLAEDEVKVFGSGSFFDEKQIPADARRHFTQECRKHKVKKITLESRPEYVKDEILREFDGLDLTVAIGLESADDELLKKLDKGYERADFEAAAEKIHTVGQKVRAYLLVNPPYTQDIAESLRKSVEYTLKHADTIVLINLLPHSNAPLMRLWVDGEWRFLTRQEFKDITKPWANEPRISLDEETFKFIPSFPQHLKDDLRGVGEWYLTHPHFEVWQDYLIRWYNPPQGKTLIFLPCAYKKPYSLSDTHKKIIKILRKNHPSIFHEVMISNAGVIPREFEDKYPFADYDWNEREETSEIKTRYIEITTERIRNYLTAHAKKYNKVVCFLKYDSESYKALAKACEELGIEYKNLLSHETYETIKDSPKPMQSDEALANLEEGVSWCLQNST